MSANSESGTHSRLMCPSCGKTTMRRDFRNGLLEQYIYPLLNYYPWECVHCRARKLFRMRAMRRSSKSE